MFWTAAAAVLLIAAAITFFPLLRGKSLLQPLALALTFAVPAAGLWIYDNFGTPQAIQVQGSPTASASVATASDAHASGAPEMDAAIAGLRARLQQNPEDVDGWMLLARTLRATQQFSEAAEVLERAHGMDPDNPLVMVELAEAWVYLTADGRIEDRSIALLERALTINPDLQKGLWLMGTAAMQRGEYAVAGEFLQALLVQLEPGSDVYNTVQSQLNDARSKAGMTPGADSPVMPEMTAAEPQEASADAPEMTAGAPLETGTWTGTDLDISASEGAIQAASNGAVLYVMIRDAAVAMGPPIGVRRIINPTLPLQVTITDRDSMMQERMISSLSEVQVQARLSLSGSPAAKPGDWQSAKQVIPLTSSATVELSIDQKVE